MPKTYAVEIDSTIFSPAGSFPTIGSLINVLVPNILIVAGIVLFIMFIFVGFQYIRQAGASDPAALQKIWSTLTMIVIGFVVIVCAFWLVKIIEIVTGVNIFKPSGLL